MLYFSLIMLYFSLYKINNEALGKIWGPKARGNGISQMVLVVKNPPANSGDLKDAGLILGSGRSPGGGIGNSPSILTWRISWTEEPGGLQRVRHD